MDDDKLLLQRHSKETLWNKDYINLLIVNVFLYLSFFLVSPILSVYAIQLGASLAFAGMIVGIFAITVLVLGPFGGVLADKTNKKYLMITATVLNAVSTLGYCISPNLTVLMVFRILHGASFSVTSATGLAWVTDYIPQNRLGEGIGYLGIAQIAATAFGPQIGISLSENYGISRSFLLASILLLVGAVCMTFVTNRQKSFLNNTFVSKDHFKLSNMVAVEILPLALIAGLFSMGSGLVSSFLVLLGQERSIAGVGLYFTVNAVLLLATRPISGKLL